MGERKVINKWYPPDFDPSLLVKRKRPKNEQIKVRMMLPMSVRCTTCGEYLYKGTKFNARKETVTGEEYLSIRIFRFYMKCNRCSAEFTIKTDPKNADYECEFGVSRNFEPWREKDKQIEEVKEKRRQEEEGDVMKALENRTMDSKIEMDILDGLDEIKQLNAQRSKMDALDALPQKRKRNVQQLDAAEEQLIRSLFGDAANCVRRIEEELPPPKPSAKPTTAGGSGSKSEAKKPKGLSIPVNVVVQKNVRRKISPPEESAKSDAQPVKTAKTDKMEDDTQSGGHSLVDY